MKSPKKVIIAILAVIIALIVIFSTIHSSHKKIRARVNSTPITQQKPKVINFTHQVSSIGSINAKQQTIVTSRINGYISKILFKEGQYVTAGTPLILLDNTQIKSQLAADQAAALMMQHQYEAINKLAPKGFASKEDLEQAYANYRAKQAAVITDKRALAETTIRAPFHGQLGAKTISLGDYVTASQKLVQIVNKDNLQVAYALPAKYIPAIKLGQTIDIHSKFGSKQTLQGKITYIAPAIDPDTRTITIHASVYNKSHTLIPGQYVSVTQSLGKTKPALFIPEQAVLQSLKGPTVFIVHKKKAKQITVTTGPIKNGLIEITSGLNKKSNVIIAGQYQLKSGQPVKIVK